MITIKDGVDIVYCNACGHAAEVTITYGRTGNFSFSLCLCKKCLAELARESQSASRGYLELGES